MSAVDWMDHALCAVHGLPSSAWTDRPTGSQWGGSDDHKAAIRICKRCPVADQCLEYIMALEANEGRSGRSGIYAATTPQRRVALQQQRTTGRRRRYGRLTVELVREIRRRAAAGETNTDIAAALGLERTNVFKVVTRQTWKDVA